MSFSYYDKDNNIKRLNIEVGKEWSSYKEKDENSLMNSVFDAVDQNSDGKVDENELNILQKLLKIADSQIDKFKNNNKIEQEELELLVEKMKNGELDTLNGNEAPNTRETIIIELPKDKDKLKNYTYLVSYYDGENNLGVGEIHVKYPNTNNLNNGKYYVDSWKQYSDKNGNNILAPFARKIQEVSNQDGTKNWSEGINRNISKIQFNRISCSSELLSFMNQVGNEQGFSIEFIDSITPWSEDLSVVRADRKQLIPINDSSFAVIIPIVDKKIYDKRENITSNTQGVAAICDDDTKKYSQTLYKEDIIQGRTYLEGGNVLNTLTKNGDPAAIIGEESIQYTICAMLALELGDSIDAIEKVKEIISDNPEEYINRAKIQIAQELGIKEENVTYIPQFDFHIDMYYRPLNDGQIAVPDYEAGINVLKDFIQDIDKELELNTAKNDNLQAKKEEYSKLITKLEDLKTKIAEISQEAENELKKQGYEIIKIPCFTDIPNTSADKVENAINYMNGICGTSAKTGDKFYVTNTSGDETLDAYMENYFKEIVGFDRIYFAPTKVYLDSKGGIDCLTKEF